MTRSFLRSLGASLGVAAAIGFGLMITFIVANATSEDNLEAIFMMFMIFLITIAGAALTGALVGIIAGRHAPGRLSAAGAGALSGLLGQFLILVMVFTAAGIIAQDESTTNDPFAEEDSSELIGWGDFATTLLYILPAGIVAALVAPLAYTTPSSSDAMPWSRKASNHDETHGSSSGFDAAPKPEPTPPTGARKLRCPECAVVNHVPPGDPIRCTGCGLSGRSPA